MRPLAIATLLLLCASAAPAASLRFVENPPQQFDFVDIPRLPADFGRGEFTFEIWLKPDDSHAVGSTWRASKMQLANWSDADPKPYSDPGWWLTGNFLLDGHTRPQGFLGGATREGTFSLQFHGGGRLRWMFADGDLDVPGKVWAVQAWPASAAPSLLDGRWHHVAAVRRWRAPEGATLELWIDGAEIARTDIPGRVDMRRWWDHLAHPDDPPELGGWALGAEVMTAWDYVFNQYEDYKGLVDDLRLWTRALSPGEIAAAAATRPVGEDGLAAHFRFDEGAGDTIADRVDPSLQLRIHRATPRTWAVDSSPAPPARNPNAPGGTP